jgi:hypothetical protein
MARTAIPIATYARPVGTVELIAAAVSFDQVNGMKFPNDGRTILIVGLDTGGDSSTNQITAESRPDPFGRIGDLVKIFSVESFNLIGPFDPVLWNQADGNVYLDSDHGANFSDAEDFRVVAVRLPY